KEAMKNMKKLRILNIVTWPTCDGSIEYLPNSLRCFAVNGYPCESLPAEFEPKMLVHLQLRDNSLHHLWTEAKVQ
ncbi:hypothetical protein, partial [Enterobacter hormaechei]|uniref:hypothetical protein n=1 Tax=Enterobacter hormaechei TaxID=158836 RepID=UPI0029DAE4E2